MDGSRRARLAPWVVASALLAGPAHAVTFSDGTLANASWTQTVTVQTGGATHGVPGQQVSGGNPGTYRRMTHTFPGAGSIGVFHEYQGGTLDLSSLAPGQALRLDYSEDSIQFSPPFVGSQIGAAPAIRQSGTVYVGPAITYTSTAWITQTLTGLSASDFTAV